MILAAQAPALMLCWMRSVMPKQTRSPKEPTAPRSYPTQTVYFYHSAVRFRFFFNVRLTGLI
jgi:hypothetical protein